MMRRLRTILCAAVAAACWAPASAQSTGAGGVGHFAKDGLAFDYPAGWALADRSTPQAQHLLLTRPGSSALMMIIAYREPITSREQLLAAQLEITEPFVQDVARKFGTEKSPAERAGACAAIGENKGVGGVSIRGSLNGQPGTAEVFPFLRGRRFVNLVYIRMDKDEARDAPAWETVRGNLKVDPPPQAAQATDETLDLLGGTMYASGVLNGKAVTLPRPEYSGFAKSGGASGLVVVQVLIDEQGDVISARAVSGHSLLLPASLEAARRAKFSPTTLCGHPTKVMGVITYNFYRF
jgi:TonB family protein